MRDRYTSGDSRSLFFPAAINKDFYKVFAVPKDIGKKEETVELLSSILGIEEKDLEDKIFKENDPYESLKNKVDEDVAQKIKELGIEGIHLENETWRYFPANQLACHLLGFVQQAEGGEKKGQYGLEEFYEKELAGKTGKALVDKDSKGQLISINKKIVQESEEGADLILTIDPNIQAFIEKKLEETIVWLKAEKGSVIVMEVETGAIKALANWPVFDPNNYGKVKNISIFVNSAVQELFEPGSIFKPITMAAALDKGAITPKTTYTDIGKVEISGYTITNAGDRTWGIQTMTEVIEKSINTGAVFAQQKVGKEAFKDYIEKFGFKEKTGIDLKGEAKGNVSNLDKKQDLEYATASFGQGIAVTAIEMISALAAVANDGILMRPYVVEKIIYKNGDEKITKPQERRRVISSETASRLTAMLVSAVENGYSKKAAVPGYLIAGKTGTSQIPDLEKGGYTEETIHTFGEFFPAYDARWAVLIKVDKPKGITYSSDSIAPLAGQIAEYILNYYEIAPSQ